RCAQAHKWKWGLLLPGAPEPRLPLLRRQDFRSVFQTALRGLSNRSIVVVGNYESGPITAEPCRAKTRPLRPRRSRFAPPEARPQPGTRAGLGWRRRVLPPGPKGLLRRPFIAIAGLRRPPEYKCQALTKKEQFRPRASLRTNGSASRFRPGAGRGTPLNGSDSWGITPVPLRRGRAPDNAIHLHHDPA